MTDVFSRTEQVSYVTDEVAQLVESIDSLLLAWMLRSGAKQVLPPPLISALDLDRIQYFDNFPHQVNVVSTVRTDEGPVDSAHLHGDRLHPADHVIPSAACYGIYIQYADGVLAEPGLRTTRVACARAEDHYERLERLRAYYVREYVYLGTADGAKSFIDDVLAWLRRLIETARLRASIETATDSFFQQDSAKALLERLSKAKREVVYRRDLAVSSVNYHRNFFGESFGIRLPSGEPVHTACFGAGLERWAAMFLDHCGGDVSEADGLVRSLHAELVS